MRILIDINHPGQVHLFKHAVWEWQVRGHKVLLVARDKDVTITLLEELQLPYQCGTTRQPGVVNLARELIQKTILLVKIARQFKPDALVSVGSPTAAWAAQLVGVPHIAFDDTEHSVEQYILYAPFTKVVYTPACFAKNLGRKQRRYEGYHELAYLHPNRFNPNPAILTKLGLNTSSPFFVVRFVSWSATHDLRQQGISSDDKTALLNMLKHHGPVIVAAETRGAPEMLDRQVEIPPAEMHNLLYYATMYVGEGGTMATEAALLGTPSVFVNTLSGGNWEELEHRYQLLYAFRESHAAIEQVRVLLADSHLKETWRARRDRLLADKIDVTQFIVNVVEQI